MPPELLSPQERLDLTLMFIAMFTGAFFNFLWTDWKRVKSLRSAVLGSIPYGMFSFFIMGVYLWFSETRVGIPVVLVISGGIGMVTRKDLQKLRGMAARALAEVLLKAAGLLMESAKEAVREADS